MYWGRGDGYNHKIDVWAIGVIFYQMLTGMFMFCVDSRTKRKDAMSQLYKKIKNGTWSWPTDVTICLSTFDFLNRTMQHDPNLRPSWKEMQRHPIFTDPSCLASRIQLDIIFDQEPEDGLAFNDHDRKIYVNTKNPALYSKLYEEAIERYREQQDDKMQDHLNNVMST